MWVHNSINFKEDFLYGPNTASFRSSSSFSKCNEDKVKNRKRGEYCGRDLNLEPQDSRRRRIHWAMAATQPLGRFLTHFLVGFYPKLQTLKELNSDDAEVRIRMLKRTKICQSKIQSKVRSLFPTFRIIIFYLTLSWILTSITLSYSFLNGPTPASFRLFLFFSDTFFTEKTVGFCRIWTRIVGVEGKHADHLTTTQISIIV